MVKPNLVTTYKLSSKENTSSSFFFAVLNRKVYPCEKKVISCKGREIFEKQTGFDQKVKEPKTEFDTKEIGEAISSHQIEKCP